MYEIAFLKSIDICVEWMFFLEWMLEHFWTFPNIFKHFHFVGKTFRKHIENQYFLSTWSNRHDFVLTFKFVQQTCECLTPFSPPLKKNSIDTCQRKTVTQDYDMWVSTVQRSLYSWLSQSKLRLNAHRKYHILEL